MFKFRLFSYKKLFQEQQKQLDAERQNKKVIQDLLNAERYKTSKFTTLKESSKKYQSTINKQEKELEELKAELLETTSKYKELDKRYSSLEDVVQGKCNPLLGRKHG